MATIKPQQNQNIFDLALQEYGSIEGIFDLLSDNGFDKVDTELSVYKDLEISSRPTRREIKEFYSSGEIHPANGITDQDVKLLDVKDKPDGIGYMIIGDDFIVEKNNTSDQLRISGMLQIENIHPRFFNPIIKSLSYGKAEPREVVGKIISDHIDIAPESAIPFSISVESDTKYALFFDKTQLDEGAFFGGIGISLSIPIDDNIRGRNIFESTHVVDRITKGEQFIIRVYSTTTSN